MDEALLILHVPVGPWEMALDRADAGFAYLQWRSRGWILLLHIHRSQDPY